MRSTPIWYAILALYCSSVGCESRPALGPPSSGGASLAKSKRTSATSSRCASMPHNEKFKVCGPDLGQDAFGLNMLMTMRLGYQVHLTGCFSGSADGGATKYLPPLTTKCSKGPRKACVLVKNPTKEWEYSVPRSDDMPNWARLLAQGLVLPELTYGYNRVVWMRTNTSCTYFHEVLSDMDGNGIYSTYQVGSTIRLGGDGETIDTLPGIRVRE